jgi:hypothetical protein
MDKNSEEIERDNIYSDLEKSLSICTEACEREKHGRELLEKFKKQQIRLEQGRKDLEEMGEKFANDSDKRFIKMRREATGIGLFLFLSALLNLCLRFF